jgi:signal transduction histidine kinase
MHILNDEEFSILSNKALLGDMLSIIVHQWKQPLSVLSILSTNMDLQLEIDNFDKERFIFWNQQIQEQIQYMSETIDDFRDFSNSKKEKQQINLKNCIERASRFTKIPLAKNDITLEIYYHATNLQVLAFHNDICQILIILISNAKDKLSLLPLEPKKIVIEVSEDEANFTITVSDNGSFIDETIMQNIFQKNFTTKENKVGNGLGLFIAKRIITEHLNGKINVKNLYNEGQVRFYLIIPKQIS